MCNFFVSEITIDNNDAYFMLITKNKIVINDNYDGIKIFDLELKNYKTIKFDNEIIFDYRFADDDSDEFILYSEEISSFFYFDLSNQGIVDYKKSFYIRDIKFIHYYKEKKLCKFLVRNALQKYFYLYLNTETMVISEMNDCIPLKENDKSLYIFNTLYSNCLMYSQMGTNEIEKDIIGFKCFDDNFNGHIFLYEKKISVYFKGELIFEEFSGNLSFVSMASTYLCNKLTLYFLLSNNDMRVPYAKIKKFEIYIT